MGWCRQETSHYLNQYWPRSVSPYSTTRPQWVNSVHRNAEWRQEIWNMVSGWVLAQYERSWRASSFVQAYRFSMEVHGKPYQSCKHTTHWDVMKIPRRAICVGTLSSFVQWASYQIRKVRVARAPGMPGTFSLPRRLAIPTCITARAWRTCRDAYRNR